MGTGTQLGRVRGLGSSHEGTHHWWRQRLTAGSNLFLMAWLMFSLARASSFDFVALHDWLRSAWVVVPIALLVGSVVYHMRLGLQVVIEDYAHAESRVVLTVLLNAYTLIVAGVALFAILRIASGSLA
ncbi:succinate dehydrogenase, hydrophobic membrane anchor protein [Sphingomonas bacterium]|uniref:succinate dehydrogenase, hydrophobic membrane anchor protein n=1 Tax=Sphingomonas bacterium TaxID=1895847 RepID=UPI001575FD75|nr:succinate dehydrogenase, hydrophobic membrane anchor protein [Sphingomonas bacterium]